jgi:Tfp pilus assembly protein PilW
MPVLTRRDESGLTLVELLVTMMLMLVVGSITVAAVVSSHKTFRHTDDEAQGLADVRTVIERLAGTSAQPGRRDGSAPMHFPPPAQSLSLGATRTRTRKELRDRPCGS